MYLSNLFYVPSIIAEMWQTTHSTLYFVDVLLVIHCRMLGRVGVHLVLKFI